MINSFSIAAKYTSKKIIELFSADGKQTHDQMS